MRWLPGDRIADRFHLVGRLAAGGMAEVHVAEMAAARGVRRRVALKRIHPHLVEDPELATMFLDEARIASQLVHPGIVAVIDAVEWQGELLLVLDYVPGWDLSTVLRQARLEQKLLPLGFPVRVGQALAEALAYVHEAVGSDGRPLGVVHRDVTPSNVLLAHDGSVRLLDFGVAKARERAARTVTLGLKGKVAYMAPEQARAGPVDARTDLYALGLVLFEMLTGRRALDAPSEIEVLDQARAPALSRVSAERSEVPAVLDDLVAALLAVDPSDRPARAVDVAHRLEVLRAELGGVSAADVRATVLALMGSDARPVDEGRGRFDRALAAAAGVELGVTGTAALPGAPPAPRQSVDETPTSRPPSRPWRSRRATAAGVALALVVVAGLGIVARPAAWMDGAADPPPPTAAPAAAVPPGFLRVASEPAGATIRVDGDVTGETTPAVIESPPGQARTIELSLDDHDTVTVQATASAGRTVPVRAALSRRKGRLTVRSTPAGAEVRVGDRVAATTPAELTDLPRVATVVRVTLAGHAPFETTVPLDAQADAVVDATLVRRVATGSLDVSSTPWAEVWVGGRRLAESTPAMGLRLPVGDHVVTLNNPRLGLRAQRRVTIREGARANVVVKLR